MRKKERKKERSDGRRRRGRRRGRRRRRRRRRGGLRNLPERHTFHPSIYWSIHLPTYLSIFKCCYCLLHLLPRVYLFACPRLPGESCVTKWVIYTVTPSTLIHCNGKLDKATYTYRHWKCTSIRMPLTMKTSGFIRPLHRSLRLLLPTSSSSSSSIRDVSILQHGGANKMQFNSCRSLATFPKLLDVETDLEVW